MPPVTAAVNMSPDFLSAHLSGVAAGKNKRISERVREKKRGTQHERHRKRADLLLILSLGPFNSTEEGTFIH